MEAEGKESYKKGLWTAEEDKILVDYVNCHGKGNWNSISKRTGLKRCGKSCRLRWMNYLSPSVKKGNFTEEEEDLIIRLHKLLGNRWSLIAGRVPGRTDNQVKNYWNTHLSKKLGIKKKETGRTRILSLAHSAKCDHSSMTNSSLESSSSIETNNRNKNISTTSITTDHIDPIHCPQIFNSNMVVDDWKENSNLELITTTAEGEKRQQQPTMINIGSENYGLNSSSMWVSEFDGLLHGNISNHGSSFTELIDGHSFDLDWDYL